MSATGFVASHARDARFERGLRSFFEYRDLGIRQATGGEVVAHVIRAAAGQEFSSSRTAMPPGFSWSTSSRAG